MLSLLLDWFPHEEHGDMIIMIAQLIQIIGGHSVTGKDIRKIFALLRNETIRSKQNCCTLLLNSIGTMLREKGPTAFFEFNGFDSVSYYTLNFTKFIFYYLNISHEVFMKTIDCIIEFSVCELPILIFMGAVVSGSPVATFI